VLLNTLSSSLRVHSLNFSDTGPINILRMPKYQFNEEQIVKMRLITNAVLLATAGMWASCGTVSDTSKDENPSEPDDTSGACRRDNEDGTLKSCVAYVGGIAEDVENGRLFCATFGSGEWISVCPEEGAVGYCRFPEPEDDKDDLHFEAQHTYHYENPNETTAQMQKSCEDAGHGRSWVTLGEEEENDPPIVGENYSFQPVTKPDGLEPRFAVRVFAVGEKAVIFGGWTGKYDSNELMTGYIYNTETDSWSASPSDFLSAKSAAAVTATSKGLLVFGGQRYQIDSEGQQTSTYVDETSFWDVETNAWTDVSKDGAPSARSGAHAATFGNRIVVFGGENDTGDLSDGGIFDLETMSWKALPSFPEGVSVEGTGGASATDGTTLWVRKGQHQFLSFDGTAWTSIDTSEAEVSATVAVWGGSSLGFLQSNAASTEIEVFDPSNPGYKVSELMPVKPGEREKRHCVVARNDTALLFGGTVNKDASKGGWAYDMKKNVWTRLDPIENYTGAFSPACSLVGSRVFFWGGNDASNGGDPVNAGGILDLGGRFD
jgi:hypothetical protein